MFLIEIVLFFILFFLPGFLQTNYLKLERIEKIILSIFLSICLTSFIFYFLSFFIQISIWTIYGYALLLVILTLLKRKAFIQLFSGITFERKKIEKQNLPELIGLGLLIIILALSFFYVSIGQPMAYDTYLYHLPIANAFAKDGKITFFQPELNVYQQTTNHYPLMFETFLGINKISFEFFWKYVSLISLIFCVLLTYLISKEICPANHYAGIFFVFCYLSITLALDYYVEIFLTMFFLGTIYFLFKYLKSNNTNDLIVMAFVGALMPLIKLTGLIFLLTILLFLIFNKKIKETIFSAIIFGIVGAFYYLRQLLFKSAGNFLGSYGTPLTTNLLQKLTENFSILIQILSCLFLVNQYFFALPLFFIISFFVLKEKKQSKLVFFTILLLIVFGLAMIANSGHPTSTGFPRYALPVYAVVCLMAGIGLKQVIIGNNKTLKIALKIIFLGFLIASALLLLLFLCNSIIYNQAIPKETYLGALYKFIPNSAQSTVFYINGGSIILGLEKTNALDFVAFKEYDKNSCNFLKEKGINYVVWFETNKVEVAEQKEFLADLKEQTDVNGCVEKKYQEGTWMTILKTK